MRAVSAIVTAPRPRAKPARGGSPPPVIVPGQSCALEHARTIAKRLAESKFSAPHFYVTVEIDMDRAVALRDELARRGQALLQRLRAAGRALALRPSRWSTPRGRREDRDHAEVNIGVAVALPTPDDSCVRQADRKGVGAIAARCASWPRRPASAGSARGVHGLDFHGLELGMYDVVEFTAIINPPDSAILAVGAVRREPVLDGDTVRPGHRMRLTLSSDHA